MNYIRFNIDTFNKPILAWRFEEAPKELQNLSNHGGDEDWLALVPAYFFEKEENPYIGWMEGNGFGCAGISEHILEDGSRVYIGAHS